MSCVVAKKVESRIAIGRLERFVGDRPAPAAGRAAALRGRLEDFGKVAIVGYRAGGALLRGQPREVRRRRDGGLRGAARSRRRAALRHPELPRLPRDIINREVHHAPRTCAWSRPWKIEPTRASARPSPGPAAPWATSATTRCSWASAPAPDVLGHRRRVRRTGLQRQRVPHARQPHGRRTVPLPRHAHRRVPARRVVSRRRNTAMDCLRDVQRVSAAARSAALPAHRGGGAGPHRGNPARQGGGHRVLFFLHAPVRWPTDSSGNVTGMRVQKIPWVSPTAPAGGAPGAARRFLELDCDTGHLRAGDEGQPNRHEVHPRPRPEQVGLHQRRRSHAATTTGASSGRRHRHRRRDRHPRDGAERAARAIASTWTAVAIAYHKEDAAAFQPRAALAAGTAKAATCPPARRRRTCAQVPQAARGRRGVHLLRRLKHRVLAVRRLRQGVRGLAPARTGCAQRAAASSP